MKKLLLILLCLPMIGIGQTHFIDQYNLQMSGNNINNDISINTYYNTLDSCNISWVIIKDSLPSQWDFSFCFPDCYATGVSSAQDLFLPNEQIFLNCHMYPNGQEGEGVIQMEITTNNLYKDTVTWTGDISSISYIESSDLLVNKNKKLIKIFDLLGRQTQQTDKYLIYLYDDKSVEQIRIID